MNIQGLQKTTLLDYPGKVACMIFTGGCNFRCPFCQNSELITSVNGQSQVDLDDFFAFLKKRQGLLEGVVVSGGEPLCQSDIASLLRKIKDYGYLVKLDTNGFFPDKLKSLVDENLVDYVAMDIKNSKEMYAKTVGLDSVDTDKIDESLQLLLNGKIEYELRTTVMNELHSSESILEMGEWVRGADKLFLQPFKDSEYVVFSGLTPPDEKKLDEFCGILRKFVGNVEIRG